MEKFDSHILWFYFPPQFLHVIKVQSIYDVLMVSSPEISNHYTHKRCLLMACGHFFQLNRDNLLRGTLR